MAPPYDDDQDTAGATSRTIPVAHEADRSSARQAGADLADEAGLDTIERHCVITSISELAANILMHAGQGVIVVRIVARPDGKRGVEVLAVDRGPGIVDPDLAMQDGYSTTGSLGGGLPGVSRLMSEVELSSTPGEGTRLRAVKWPK